MTREVFITQLQDLNNDVIKMGSILELSLNEMIMTLNKIDVGLAKKIIIRDDDIDLLEQHIERECIHMIARQQPFASDLRKITSIMKIITDIERIADHCSDISEYIITLSEKPMIQQPKYISEMISAMKTMIIDTIDSFVTSDIEKATEVILSDDIVDNYFENIYNELIEMMEQDKTIISQCVCYLMIIKYIERMADHATNIAGWIKFIVTGEFVLEE